MASIYPTAYEQRRAKQRAFGEHLDRGKLPRAAGTGVNSASTESEDAHTPGILAPAYQTGTDGHLELDSRCMSCGCQMSLDGVCTACGDVSNIEVEKPSQDRHVVSSEAVATPTVVSKAHPPNPLKVKSPKGTAPAPQGGNGPSQMFGESISMGGPGSGWHASGGHVAGSQGGKADAASRQAERTSSASTSLSTEANSATRKFNKGEMKSAKIVAALHREAAGSHHTAAAQHADAAKAHVKTGAKARAEQHQDAAEYHAKQAAKHERSAQKAGRLEMQSLRAYHVVDPHSGATVSSHSSLTSAAKAAHGHADSSGSPRYVTSRSTGNTAYQAQPHTEYDAKRIRV